jgi:hypothetical protein
MMFLSDSMHCYSDLIHLAINCNAVNSSKKMEKDDLCKSAPCSDDNKYKSSGMGRNSAERGEHQHGMCMEIMCPTLMDDRESDPEGKSGARKAERLCCATLG